MPGHPPPRPHLCDQQDQPPLQGAPGLNSPAVSAVIFDVGNVLYAWEPEAFLAREIADEDSRARFIADTDLWAWHDGLDGGAAFAPAAAELAAHFPQHAATIDAWGTRFGETIGDPVPGVHAIVEALGQGRVPLFAITNFSAEFWAPFAAREKAFFGRFRDIVVSGEEKLLKPDPRLYRLALERFGQQAEHCLFIDDRPDNVAGAEAVGMHGHLFEGADSLRLCLHDLNLL